MTNAIQSIALTVVRVADKKGLLPKDIAHFPHILAAAGLDAADLTPEVITEANRIDRQESRALIEKAANIGKKTPKTSATPIEQISQGEALPKTKEVKVPRKSVANTATSITTSAPRVKIFGLAPTAILRWMGSKDWSAEDAATALHTLGATNISDATIRIQLNAGKKGERGGAPVIAAKDAKKLKAASL
jgi:cytoskeletal protein RodZ